MLIKACARPACEGLITERYPARLAQRVYCSKRCTQWAGTQTRKRGTEHARRAAFQIQRALGLTGEPPRALIDVVQRIRQNAYQAGWTCVTRKLQRAVKRGVLVRPVEIEVAARG